MVHSQIDPNNILKNIYYWNTIIKLLLFRMQYIIDEGCLFNDIYNDTYNDVNDNDIYLMIHIVNLLFQWVNQVIHLFFT